MSSQYIQPGFTRINYLPALVAAPTLNHHSVNFLKDDPLNDYQKEIIQCIVNSFILTNEITQCHSCLNGRVVNIFEKFFGTMEPFTTLCKTYDSFNPNILQTIEKIMGSERFNQFRLILKNPEFIAKDLGLSSTGIFAAQTFIKQAVKGIGRNLSMDQIHLLYKQKMISSRRLNITRNYISEKNRLLMANDPLKKLSFEKPDCPLSAVLANTHFKEPLLHQFTIYPDGKIQMMLTGPTREQTRALMIEELKRLDRSEELGHVIQALGTLIAKEKGNILFGSTDSNIELLANPYLNEVSIDGLYGLYNGRHSILLASMVTPQAQINPLTLGTFIHESLHFLFSKIIGEDASPTKHNSCAGEVLDQALHFDREHRKTLNIGELSNSKREVYYSLVYQLENNDKNYFLGGFNPNNPQHLHTMRTEAIVRVMEQIANGGTSADVMAVAPNLCAFYYTYSKPLLEQYTRDNAHLFCYA